MTRLKGERSLSTDVVLAIAGGVVLVGLAMYATGVISTGAARPWLSKDPVHWGDASRVAVPAAALVVGLVAAVVAGHGQATRTRELAASRDANVTDRYTKAVEQLAAESETIRLGGIYALERIYADSPRDRDTIGNLLMTFVSAANRNHALKSPWRVRFWPSGLLKSGRRRVRTAARSLTRLRFSQTEAPTYELPAKRAPADVAGAMQVLGRLSPKPQTSISFAGHSVGEVEISGADFRGVEFWSADFSHSTFSGVDFRRAKFNFSDLKFAKFVGCDLRGVTFELADLRSATFMQCEMAGSDFWAANLTSAALPMVDLTDVNLSGAVMRKTGVDPEQMLTANWATEPYVEEDYLLEAVAERTAQLNAVADYPVSPFDNGPNRWLDR